jgi:hypothetical protein
MLSPFDEGIMPKASTAKLRDRLSNVIAFPQAPRLHLAIRCDDARVAVCSHCGGQLAEGESEDDCSSVRVSQSS